MPKLKRAWNKNEVAAKLSVIKLRSLCLCWLVFWIVSGGPCWSQVGMDLCCEAHPCRKSLLQIALPLCSWKEQHDPVYQEDWTERFTVPSMFTSYNLSFFEVPLYFSVLYSMLYILILWAYLVHVLHFAVYKFPPVLAQLNLFFKCPTWVQIVASSLQEKKISIERQ